MEKASLESSLVETLYTSDLSSIVVDLGEVGIDALTGEGVAREIPIISTLLRLWNTGTAVRDWLFVRKLCAFLGELKDINPRKRQKMIDGLERDPSFNQKVGEHLVLLLDRLDDMGKPVLLGRAFRAYCEGIITGEQLRHFNRVIDRAFVPHLSHLHKFLAKGGSRGSHPLDGSVLQSFTDCGLAWVLPNQSSTNIAPTKIAEPFLRYVLREEPAPPHD